MFYLKLLANLIGMFLLMKFAAGSQLGAGLLIVWAVGLLIWAATVHRRARLPHDDADSGS